MPPLGDRVPVIVHPVRRPEAAPLDEAPDLALARLERQPRRVGRVVPVHERVGAHRLGGGEVGVAAAGGERGGVGLGDLGIPAPLVPGHVGHLVGAVELAGLAPVPQHHPERGIREVRIPGAAHRVVGPALPGLGKGREEGAGLPLRRPGERERPEPFAPRVQGASLANPAARAPVAGFAAGKRRDDESQLAVKVLGNTAPRGLPGVRGRERQERDDRAEQGRGARSVALHRCPAHHLEQRREPSLRRGIRRGHAHCGVLITLSDLSSAYVGAGSHSLCCPRWSTDRGVLEAISEWCMQRSRPVVLCYHPGREPRDRLHRQPSAPPWLRRS